MSDFLKKCEEYFASRCFYAILQIPKDASAAAIKKAYHKLSLQVHPDRVAEPEKEVATEKFKVLGKIYSTLQDDDRRKTYDDRGEFEEDDATFNWFAFWSSIFKPLNRETIDKYKNEYIGSEREKTDIKKAYISSRGNMNVIVQNVMFADIESESRFIDIVKKMVDDGEVEAYESFFKEPKAKRLRRHQKRKREQEEFKKLNVDLDELDKQLEKNREERGKRFAQFMTDLEKKYKGGDASKTYAIDGARKKRKSGGEGVSAKKKKK